MCVKSVTSLAGPDCSTKGMYLAPLEVTSSIICEDAAQLTALSRQAAGEMDNNSDTCKERRTILARSPSSCSAWLGTMVQMTPSNTC